MGNGMYSTDLCSKQSNYIILWINCVVFCLLQPIQLLNYVVTVAKPGKIPSGKTEIPFELPLKPKVNKSLYETYHGVFVNVQVGHLLFAWSAICRESLELTVK